MSEGLKEVIYVFAVIFFYFIGAGWAYNTHLDRNPDLEREVCVDGECKMETYDPDSGKETAVALIWPIYAALIIGEQLVFDTSCDVQ